MSLVDHTKGGLVPFRRLIGGEGLYESEIEEHFWSDLELITGDTLSRSPVSRSFPTVGFPTLPPWSSSGALLCRGCTL